MSLHDEAAIRRLVFAFYDRIRDDAVLGPLFETRIGDRWDEHLERMCDFWSTVLLHGGRYRGDPVAAHARNPGISPAHFDRWLTLFDEVAHAQLTDPQAHDVVGRARRMRRAIEPRVVDQPRSYTHK